VKIRSLLDQSDLSNRTELRHPHFLVVITALPIVLPHRDIIDKLAAIFVVSSACSRLISRLSIAKNMQTKYEEWGMILRCSI